MSTRRLLLAAITLLLVIIIIGTAGLAGVLLLRQGRGQVGQLLVLGDDSRLVLLDAAGGERVLANDTTSAGFLYPAPSPDGARVAYVASGGDGTALQVLNLADGARTELYRTPRVLRLFYLNWAPDGATISFLTTVDDGGLGVYVVPADGSAPATVITSADQLLRSAYFAWTPDGRRLLLHLNGSVFEEGSLQTFTLGGAAPEPLTSSPGFFQSPAWSSDGTQVFFVAQPPVERTPTPDDVQSVLTRAAPDGSGATELAREPGAVLFFSRAPASDQIGYVTLNLSSRSFGALTLVDGRSGERRVVSREGDRVVAFFWSPDGTQLAYLTRTDDSDPSSDHTWHLVSSAGGEVRELSSFSPTPSFSGLLNFFDTYALSLPVWSPDSRRLTYAAADGVYVLDTRSGVAQRMAAGALGLWVAPGR